MTTGRDSAAQAAPAAPAAPTAAAERRAVRLITVSASYGSGGSVVAPALARRLGVPFLQRATTSGGDLADPTPVRECLSADERRTTPVHRVFASLAHAMPVGPTVSPPSAHHQYVELRRHGEAEIAQLATGGEGVVLGRAAAIVLGKRCGFHVRLDGPPERRVLQGAAIERTDAEEARAHLRAADAARTAYARRLYHADPADASHYHLVIDSTAIALDAVTELILVAAQAAELEA